MFQVHRLSWGPFRMSGILGILVNTYACIYMVIVIFFSFWSPEMNPSLEDMKFGVVGTVGVVILTIAYYLLCSECIRGSCHERWVVTRSRDS